MAALARGEAGDAWSTAPRRKATAWRRKCSPRPRSNSRGSPRGAAASCGTPGETVRTAYIGGVFRSAIVLQRFRELVAAAGCVSGPPVFGPAAGALLEAYRAAGLQPPLSNVPEFKT